MTSDSAGGQKGGCDEPESTADYGCPELIGRAYGSSRLCRRRNRGHHSGVRQPDRGLVGDDQQRHDRWDIEFYAGAR